MKYNVVIEQTVTKTYGKDVRIEADSEDQAREQAEGIAIEATSEEIEGEWELLLDCESTWTVTVAKEAA